MGIENQIGTDALASSTSIKFKYLEDEMNKSFLDYAMSVIISRALPDVRDGMKPVHRRIVYAMWEKDNMHNKPFRKCAKTVGEVIGTYHPHGDQAVYESMVRLGQDWVQRHRLIEAQGNFGSRDGDPAAAYRYTEARLEQLASYLVADLDKSTVKFADNYDGSVQEPRLLPARWPNLIVNGQVGIAVGMATNIPSHNLSEAIDACLLVMDNPEATIDDIMTVMPGPDFATSGFVLGKGGVRQAYETGRGSIRVAGKWEIVEQKRGNTRIIITEMPWGTNAVKTVLGINNLRKAAEKLKKDNKEYDKIIDSIADVVDETAKDLRFYVEVKRDADPQIVLNWLKKKTPLVTSFPVNMTVLNSQGQPEVMGMKKMIVEFVAFRRQTVRLRTIHELNAARKALTFTIGLYAAVSMVDRVVTAIRASENNEAALERLLDIDFPTEGELAELLHAADPDFAVDPNYRLTEEQAKHVLDMRLGRLTNLGTQEIGEKARSLVKDIDYHNSVLNDRSILDAIVRDEMVEIKNKFHSPRLTEIIDADPDDVDDEDLIEHKEIVVTFSRLGYVKRTGIEAYREQKRGGKGRNGMETKDDDFIQDAIYCSTKTPLLAVTSRGISHTIKAYRLPEGAPAAKGRYIGNFINLMPGETITNILPMPLAEEGFDGLSVLFVTDYGKIRRNQAADFAKINKSGKIAIKLEDENGRSPGNLVKVLLARDTDDIMIATREGMVCRFQVGDLRVMNSRTSDGVKAISLREADVRKKGDDGDKIIDACVVATFEATPQEREAYLNGGTVKFTTPEGEEKELVLTAERMKEMASNEEFILTVTANGYGKRSSSFGYRRTSRGGVGFKGGNINDQTGNLVACFTARDEDGLVLITDGGQAIRTRVDQVKILGRATRGVKVFSVPESQRIVSVARVEATDEVEDAPAVTATA
jgi:DNA gyrase subunit A